MNWLYRSFILSFIIATSPHIEAHTSTVQVDSILNIVNKIEGSKKLEKLEEYISLYKNNIILPKELEKEALKQDNQLYIAIANQMLIYHFAVEGNRDSMKTYIDRTSEYLTLFLENKYERSSKEDKEKYSKSKSIVVATKATVYIDEGKYNLALAEIKKGLGDSIIGKKEGFKSQAYNLIGIAYLYTKKPIEALSSFNKAIEINKREEEIQKNGDESIGKYRYYSALEGSTIAYILMGEYQKALLIADSLEARIENEYKLSKSIHGENPNDTFKYNFLKNRTLCYSAKANIKLGNLSKAKMQLDHIGHFVSEISPDRIHQDFDIYSYVEVEYYLSASNYYKAKELASSLSDRVSIDYQPYSYMEAKVLFSEVLHAEGKYEEAYDLLRSLYHTNDSINAANFSKEFAEMETKLDLNKARFLISETNLKLKNTQMLLLVVAISLLLSCIVCYIVWKNKKILKDKNKQLYKQYKEIEQRNKKITELQSIHQNMIAGETQDEDINSEIMEKLVQYLTETKIYLDSEITREEVALAIGTNRQYLIEAIKDKTGRTFNEFIYSYRLQYAYELLINNRDQTISDILQESGFHSRATFYNAFKDAYGMTPSELRNILN